MTVTGKKRSGRKKQSPEKTAEYTLVFQNQEPTRVKPKRKKTLRPEPVSFVMQQRELFVMDDDTI